MNLSSTIVALSTGRGGAISLIRLSGNQSFSIVDKLFHSKSGIKLCEAPAYRAMFGSIVDNDGSVVDEVIVTIYKSPRSYSGEDMVEISCHASYYIESRIIELLIQNGASTAAPGEFTQRAYLNGKLDLVQAEAVADIIASTSQASHRLAMNQMKGGFSREFSDLRDKLLNLTTLLELELDFSEEDVEFADRSQLKLLLQEVIDKTKSLVDSFRAGNAIKNGVPIAIVGSPNVGKSTLLNSLVKHERAIVSHIAGTTRDTVEDSVVIGGLLFRFIDTAGIRHTEDVVEKIGIERTFQNIEKASVVILVVDATSSNQQVLEQIATIHLEQWQQLLVVVNKCDLIDTTRQTSLANCIAKATTAPQFFSSAEQNIGVPQIEQHLSSHYAQSLQTESVTISNARHIELLTLSLESSNRAMTALIQNQPNDLTATDTRQTITHLSTLIGDINTNTILQNIFSNFCIGK